MTVMGTADIYECVNDGCNLRQPLPTGFIVAPVNFNVNSGIWVIFLLLELKSELQTGSFQLIYNLFSLRCGIGLHGGTGVAYWDAIFFQDQLCNGNNGIL